MEYKNLKSIGYPGYQIDLRGNVYSNKKKKNNYRLRWKLSNTGYLYVGLYDKNSFQKNMFIHKLLLLIFKPGKHTGKECRHLNGIKTDNRLINLEWGTTKENAQDKSMHGKLKGEKNPQSKLKEIDVIKMRKLYATGNYTQLQIAKIFSLSKSHTHDILNRKAWSHVQ